MEGKKLFIQNDKGQKLAAWLHKGKDDSRIVIQAHGYPSDSHFGHKDRAEILSDSGLTALRFDFRGCGDSDGDFSECMISTAIADVESVFAWVKNNGFNQILLLGSSFGGAVMLHIAARHPEVSKLLLQSPAPDCSDPAEWGITAEEWKEKGFVEYKRGRTDESIIIPYQYYVDAVEHIAFDIAKEVKIPTLIVHGDQDDVVPLEHAKKLAQIMPDAKLIVLEGAGHKLEVAGDWSAAAQLMVEWLV